MRIFLQLLWENPAYYFCWLIVVLFSATLHDFVHTKVIEHCDEEQAQIRGTYTLNPFRTYHGMSLICLFLFGIIWGIPPVRSDMLKQDKHGYIIHLAGPLTNLALAIAAAFLLFLVLLPSKLGLNIPGLNLYTFFIIIFGNANCLLAILNMLPIPGLDGWGILEIALDSFRNMDFQKKNIINFTAILLLWGTPISKGFFILQELLFYLINLPFLKCLNMF